MSQSRSDGSVLISAKITEEVFKKGLSAMQAELNRFSSSAISDFNTLSKGSDAFGSSLGRAAKTAAGLATAYLSVSKAVAGLASGVDYNRQLESAQLGIASILASTHKLIDAQGHVLKGQEKFLAAQKMSVEMAKALDVASYQSTADYTNLLQAFQAALGAGSARGLGWQDTLDVVVKMSNVLESMGYSMEFLDYETRRLLSGFDMANSRVGKQLGITAEMVKSWGKGEKYLKNLNKYIGVFEYTGQAAEKTLSAVSSLFSDMQQTIAGDITKNFFESYKNSLRIIAEAFTDIDKAAKQTTITKEMKALVQLGQDVASVFGKNMEDAAQGFVSSMASLSGFVDSNRSSIDSLGRGVKELAGYWDVAAIALAAHTASQKVAKSATEGWIATQRQSIQVWREQSKVETDSLIATAKAQKEAAELEQARVAWKTRQVDLMAKSLIGTKEEERAVAMLTVQQQKLAVADAQVAAATLAVEAAQKKATLSSRAFAAVQAGAAKVAEGFKSLVNMLGGPVVVGFTLVTSAVYALSGRQTEAEKIAEKYSNTIAGIKKSAEDAEKALGDLEKRVLSLSKEQATFEIFDAEKSFEAVRAELEKFKGEAKEASRAFVLGPVETSPFAEIIDQFLQGQISAEEFRKKAYGLGTTLSESGREAAKGIIEISYSFETALKWLTALKAATSGSAGGIGAVGDSLDSVTAQANKSTASLSKTKKELMSLADFTKKFRTELDQMQGVAGSDFAKGLQDGLKSLRSELDKVKGVTKEVREGFEREFTFAFSDKAIRDVKQEMMGLNGQFAELAAIEIDQKVAAYAAALEKASPAARAAAVSTEQYKAALEKKVATDNLQDQVSFFKELADLSGDYGLSLEYQNKLIDIQAQRYKALFANEPQLQGFVDQWAELAKKAQNAQTAIERAVNVSWKRLEQGTGTGVDVMTAALGSVMDGYKNVAHSTAQIWGDFFTSFSKGAADSIGQAIVYGEDLGESLNNVAQQAIASLISSFMELAIQAAIVKPLMESLGLAMGDKGAGDAEAVKAKTEAELASIAEISAARIAATTAESAAAVGAAAATAAAMAPIAAMLTAMWTEPAFLASAASYGASATTGLTALQTSLAQFRASLGATTGFDEGGYTGNGSTNSVVGVVHGQEYVLNAATTRSIGVSNLDAINASGSLASVFTGRASALSNLERPQSGGDMYVNVVNNASDTTVSQQQSADANGNMRLDIIIDDIMAGKVVNGSTARSLQSAYGLRKTGFRV